MVERQRKANTSSTRSTDYYLKDVVWTTDYWIHSEIGWR